MGLKKHYKKHFAKKNRKVFTKKSKLKNPNRFFLDIFSSRFWAFLGEGSSKTP
jgi:hypothetical protein